MPDTRWLEQRRQGWYCVKDVPRPLQAQAGKKRLVKSLGTRSLAVAQLRRWDVIAAWERELAVVRRQPDADALTAEAMEWRAEYERLRAGQSKIIPEDWAGPDEAPEAAQAEFLAGQLAERAEALTEELSPALGAAKARAKVAAFFDTAIGRATPLDTHVDAWIAEGGKNGPVVASVAKSYRRAVSEFSAWCAKEGRPGTIEAVTQETTGAFASHLLTTDRQRSTLNNVVFALSAYWTWLGKRRGFSKDNPWEGQTLPEGADRGEVEEERPFTDAEVAVLLGGDADQVMADAMRIAALTGMRIGEMHELRVNDCTDGRFRVWKSKTRNGARRWVPMHPYLVPVVARLSEGKKFDDYLLPSEAKRCRYDGLTGRFRRYQQQRGVYDREGGRRRSLVNWHSFRRWFVMKAEQAGIARETVALVVGHKRLDVTFGTYSRDADALWAPKRACVEAVKLPEPSPEPIRAAG